MKILRQFSKAAVSWVLVAVGVLTLAPMLGAWVSLGSTWSFSPVGYYVNPNNISGLSNAAVTNALQTASSAWSQSGADFAFQYKGTTTINTSAYDGVNAVFFRPAANGSAVATTYSWRDANYHLLDADTIFWEQSFQFFAGNSGCVNGFYVEDVATHEFGHALGLAHSPVLTATMYPYISSYCTPDSRYLDPDDIAGIQGLYGVASVVQAPAAPSQLTVSINNANPASSLAVSWADNSTNEDGYRLDRSQDGANFVQIAQLGASSTSYVDTGLAAGTTYYYRVHAYNAAGSSDSNIASGQTHIVLAAPSAPSNPTPGDGATVPNATLTLSWSCSGAEAYDVYVNGVLYVSNLTSPSVTVTSLVSGSSYSWVVVARNAVASTSGPSWSFTVKASNSKRGGPKR